MLLDIEYFEKSSEERATIENVCRACAKFSVGGEIRQTITLADGTTETQVVENTNSVCLKNNIVLVFSQIKGNQQCPEGRW
jgi:hypothetical protein